MKFSPSSLDGSTLPSTRPASNRVKGRLLLAACSLLTGLACAPHAGAVVTFNFNFTDPANTGFNDPTHPEYKAALIAAGQVMGSYFANTATVVMTVSSTNDPNSATLASAGSPTISPNGQAGFFPSVVEAKITSNGSMDPNGTEDDGSVNVNLGASFQYDADSPTASGKIDFRATMIHELTHAFGFSSNIEQGPATGPALYSMFDAYLVNSAGTPLINPLDFTFMPNLTYTLTGGNNTLMDTPSANGEFFKGGFASQRFGQPIPLFCPNPYQPGSSGSHVDDNTTATKYFLMASAVESATATMGMNMTRTYSSAEEGIMKDLGYTLASDHPKFAVGETALQNNVYYLSFPNGNIFGYYSYLPGSERYIYHQDLGYEYTFEANDGKAGVYLYDFASSGFFYTSPTFPFPYLYDFALNSVVYYYPDPNNAGRYNTNGVRYFYVFNSGSIISK